MKQCLAWLVLTMIALATEIVVAGDDNDAGVGRCHGRAPLIVQLGDPSTGTTLLVNVLYGLLDPHRAVVNLNRLGGCDRPFDVPRGTVVIKSHSSEECVHSMLPERELCFVHSRRNGSMPADWARPNSMYGQRGHWLGF